MRRDVPAEAIPMLLPIHKVTIELRGCQEWRECKESRHLACPLAVWAIAQVSNKNGALFATASNQAYRAGGLWTTQLSRMREFGESLLGRLAR